MRSLQVMSVLSWLSCAAVASAGPAIQINEIRIDQPSTDYDEYFELTGTPGASLSGLTYLVIGDGTGGSGVIESVTNLTGFSINASGFFLVAESTFTLSGTPDLTVAGNGLNFENGDNLTHLLVSGFSGASGNDLDTNDDGVLDVTPWISILDLIAMIVEDNPPTSTEYHYGPPTVGPDGAFVPGHAYRCSPGGAWVIGAFDPVGGADTPGAVNPSCVCGDAGTGNCFQAHPTPFCDNAECCDLVCSINTACCTTGWSAACAALAATECTVPGPAPDVNLNEIRTGQPGLEDPDEYFELSGAPFTSLDGVAYIVIGDGGSTTDSGVIENVTVLSGTVIIGSGLFVGAQDTFTLGLADLTAPLNFEDGDNVTHMLVFNFMGTDGQDLDVDDNGVLDTMPWGELMDSVAIVGSGVPGVDGNHVYSPTTVGPDGTLTPGQVYRCTPAGTWKVGPFDPADVGETDTPGAANVPCSFVSPCGSSVTGSCFEAHATPNCAVASCCSLVCMTSPSCCTTAWTQACADQAQVQCLSCGDPQTGSCYQIGATPYCQDASCCTEVCALDPSCCNADWDQACVDLANANCEIAAVMITEIVDGTLPGGQPKWVEITNCAPDAVDLSTYSLGNFNNGSLTMSAAASGLTGLLNPGDSFIFSYSPDTDTTFMTVYGFAPDQFGGSGSINGNDVVALFLGQATGDGSNATLIDVYGVIGQDGVGSAWEYTDSYASRNASSTPSVVFDPGQWTIAGPDALEDPGGDDLIETMNLQQNTNPGDYDCGGPQCPACVGDFAPAPSGNGTVNAADLALLLGNWGSGCQLSAGCCMDINGVNGVNAADLALLLGNWGACQ